MASSHQSLAASPAASPPQSPATLPQAVSPGGSHVQLPPGTSAPPQTASPPTSPAALSQAASPGGSHVQIPPATLAPPPTATGSVNTSIGHHPPPGQHLTYMGYGAEGDEGLGPNIERVQSSFTLPPGLDEHVFENNRRYHRWKDGRYLLPNDEREQEREDMAHAMVNIICDKKLHFAPVRDPQRILDVGTGTGIWVINIADEFRGAEITGIDISPTQTPWWPPNVRFLLDDAEADGKLEDDNSLDYVHMRFMCMAIRDWPRTLRSAYNAIKPGGWIELQDLRWVVKCEDDTCPPDYGVTRLINEFSAGFRAHGIDVLAMERNKDMLIEAGFCDVQERVWKVPIGMWEPRDIKLKTVGLYCGRYISDGLESMTMAPLTRYLGYSCAEVHMFLIDVRTALKNMDIHAYLTFHAV